MLFPTPYPVTCHTSKVGPGSTFVAIKGHSANGLDFIQQAVERGATTIIAEHQDEAAITHIPGITYQFVDNARIALAERAAQALDYPAKKLKIIGVTGTKGKTTTTFMTEHVLRHAGFKTALLGGVYNKIGYHKESSPLTTMGADDLHIFFAQCVKAEVEYVVMEASAHTTSQHRTHGIEFEALGFTNFGQDHLDYYGTMEKYFEAKLAFLPQIKKGHTLVVNADNDWSGKIIDHLKKTGLDKSVKLVTISNWQEAVNRFNIITDGFDGLTLEITTPHEAESGVFACDAITVNFTTPLIAGEFNAYNLVMAGTLCAAVGISWNIITEALHSFAGTPGRLQQHRLANGARAFVDFAHNPSSFEAVLKVLRPLTSHLIVLFGCGGNRDTSKRPLMGALAAHFGDLVIVTDDNPRNEDRMAIIEGIIGGAAPEDLHKLVIEPDRKAAVKRAVAEAKPHSIVALLGKGHEQYYLINGLKIEYNDWDEIEQY